MSTRIAVANDAHKMAEIQINAWLAAYIDLMPADFLKDLNIEETSKNWRRSLTEANPGIYRVVLNDAGLITGYCVYGPARDADLQKQAIGEIVAINILPAEWRKGYGRELLQAVLAHAEKLRWQAMSLWVIKNNQQARDFYQALGFEADGAEKYFSTLIKAPLHELRYKKLLGNSET